MEAPEESIVNKAKEGTQACEIPSLGLQVGGHLVISVALCFF